jgi:branched-chain amino acid transport system substrate-binding protein
MKKLVLLALVLFMVIAPTACAPAAPAKADTIKLGWFGALSGDQAVWGQADKNGVILSVEQVNKAGGILGKQVEVVYYDDKGEQLESINAVKRLINEDKVVGIIGTNSSGRQIAVAPVVEEGKVPVISTFATNPRVTVPEAGKLMKYTFRAAFIDPYSGEVTANFAWNDLKARKAAILYEISSDYSVGVRQYFSEAWKKLGGEIVADEAFKTGDVDFRAQLTRIKETNPDVLIMPYMYKEVALSAKQARELGIKATMLGGDGWPSLALLEMAGPAVEGSYFIDHGDIKAPNVQEFRQAYKDKFSKEIEITALMGHDAFMMMKAGIEAAGKAEPTAIRDALENLKNVKLFTGTISVDPATHNPIGKSAAIINIKDGAFQFFKMFEPMK